MSTPPCGVWWVRAWVRVFPVQAWCFGCYTFFVFPLRLLAPHFKAAVWVSSLCRCITHMLAHIKAYLPLLCPITCEIFCSWRKSFTKYRNANYAFISMHCDISFCKSPWRDSNLLSGSLKRDLNISSLSTNMLKGHLLISILVWAWLFCKCVLVLLGRREKDFGSLQVYLLKEELPLWKRW